MTWMDDLTPDAANGTVKDLHISGGLEFGAYTMGGTKNSDAGYCIFAFGRKGTDGDDDFTGNALLLGVEILYDAARHPPDEGTFL
jgi:hypothetical protein